MRRRWCAPRGVQLRGSAATHNLWMASSPSMSSVATDGSARPTRSPVRRDVGSVGLTGKPKWISVPVYQLGGTMNPVLNNIFRDLAHGTAVSALPGAPVVPHVPGRATILRGQLGAALHRVAGRI